MTAFRGTVLKFETGQNFEFLEIVEKAVTSMVIWKQCYSTEKVFSALVRDKRDVQSA